VKFKVENPRDKFERTKCDCKICTMNCRHMPGALIPEDIIPMYEATLYTREHWVCQPGDRDIDSWARWALLASDGARVVKDGVTINIPSLVPRNQTGGCIFLTNGKCDVHQAAPFGCSHFDTHMNPVEGHDRSQAYLQRIYQEWEENPEGFYCTIWHKLNNEGRKPEQLQQRRDTLQAATQKLEKQIRRKRSRKK